jgi:hypothetical protein
MPAKKRTKYDKLTAVNSKLSEYFGSIEHRSAQQLALIFGNSGPDTYAKIKEKDPSVTRSDIAAGLEQGLRDLESIVSGQPEEVRANLVAAFTRAVKEEYPEFFKKDIGRLAKILERGRIQSSSEWYLLRDRIDQIEGTEEHDEELRLLYRLVDDYGVD